MITSYELAEYANCPRRAYYLHTFGCTTVHMATQVREYLRVLCAFSNIPTSQNAVKTPHTSLKNAIAGTRVFLLEIPPAVNSADKSSQEQPLGTVHAVVSADESVAAYVPLCTWNASVCGWDLHFPTATAGLRPDQKIRAMCAVLQCEALGVPLARILLHTLLVDERRGVPAGQRWHIEEISIAVQKYRGECTAYLDEMSAIFANGDAQDEKAWKGCGKRYCDVCKAEQGYEYDDVRTLRKSKRLVDDMLECGITRIQDIPLEVELHTSARRQVKAVRENRRLLFRKEIRAFLHRLAYPRCYLDFEGLSTAVPLFQGVKPGGFVPFLFSAQWQNYDADAVHTQLWGMPPAVDKRVAMWQQLKPLLEKAQSIIVYSRHFEDEMIRHLAQQAGEPQLGERLTEKIVDLQELFFYLSVYDPQQRGKISLKTLASVWLQNDYGAYSVQDGMEANYFFTAMADTKQRSLETLEQHAYPTILFAALKAFDRSHTITLNDIAQYCKYDTAVMIRLVSLLENEI